MAKVEILKVALRKSLIVKQRESSEIVLEAGNEITLEAGTLVKVAAISGKDAWFTGPEYGGEVPSHKTRHIKFYGPNHNCLSIGWSDIVPPEECLLITKPPFIYCAMNDNFIHIEMVEDISHCSLCGKDLRDIHSTKRLLEQLSDFDLSTYVALSAVETIVDSIELLGITTWEELGTTLDECNEFARLTHVEHLKAGIDKLKEPLHQTLKENIVDNIKNRVEEGLTTWEELGISEDKLHELIQ